MFCVDCTCNKAADSSPDRDVGSQAAVHNVARLLSSAMQHLSFEQVLGNVVAHGTAVGLSLSNMHLGRDLRGYGFWSVCPEGSLTFVCHAPHAMVELFLDVLLSHEQVPMLGSELVILADEMEFVVFVVWTDLGRYFGSWICSCLDVETPHIGSCLYAKEELCPAFLGGLPGDPSGPACIQRSFPAIDLFAVIRLLAI